MDREQLSRHLDVAQRHVVEAGDRITRMQEIASELEQDGHTAAAAMARELIETFEPLLQDFIEHRDRLEDQFKKDDSHGPTAAAAPPLTGDDR